MAYDGADVFLRPPCFTKQFGTLPAMLFRESFIIKIVNQAELSSMIAEAATTFRL